MNYDEMIQISKEIIENKLSEKISVTRLAENVFFSKHHFQRLFQAIVGDSVMEYVKKRRLTLASVDLCETNVTVLDIALKYGYSSHEGFTRAFKSYFGISPNKFRKNGIGYFSEFNILEAVRMSKDSPVFIRSSENIKEIVKMLENFSSGADNLSVFINEVVSKDEWRAKAFKILSSELTFLNERSKYACEKICEFDYASNNAFDVCSMIFKVNKTLDDVAFQMNVLTFFSSIESARCSEPREQFELIVNKFKSLCDSVVCEKEKTVTMLMDLISLIVEDIKNEALSNCTKISEQIKNLSKEGRDIYDETELMTEKLPNGKALVFIVSETLRQSKVISQISDKLYSCIKTVINSETGKAFENPESTQNFVQTFDAYMSEIIRELEDMAFLSNIVAFNAKVEAARAGDKEEYNNITNKLLCFAGHSQENAKTCFDIWDEVKKKLSILEYGKAKSNRSLIHKSVSDISFQHKILSYQFQLESERWTNAVFIALSAELYKSEEIISKLLRLYIDLDMSEIKTMLAEYSAKKKLTLDKINDELVKAGQHGEPLHRIVSEYEYFIARVNNVIDEIEL